MLCFSEKMLFAMWSFPAFRDWVALCNVHFRLNSSPTHLYTLQYQCSVGKCTIPLSLILPEIIIFPKVTKTVHLVIIIEHFLFLEINLFWTNTGHQLNSLSASAQRTSTRWDIWAFSLAFSACFMFLSIPTKKEEVRKRTASHRIVARPHMGSRMTGPSV